MAFRHMKLAVKNREAAADPQFCGERSRRWGFWDVVYVPQDARPPSMSSPEQLYLRVIPLDVQGAAALHKHAHKISRLINADVHLPLSSRNADCWVACMMCSRVESCAMDLWYFIILLRCQDMCMRLLHSRAESDPGSSNYRDSIDKSAVVQGSHHHGGHSDAGEASADGCRGPPDCLPQPLVHPRDAHRRHREGHDGPSARDAGKGDVSFEAGQVAVCCVQPPRGGGVRVQLQEGGGQDSQVADELQRPGPDIQPAGAVPASSRRQIEPLKTAGQACCVRS